MEEQVNQSSKVASSGLSFNVERAIHFSNVGSGAHQKILSSTDECNTSVEETRSENPKVGNHVKGYELQTQAHSVSNYTHNVVLQRSDIPPGDSGHKLLPVMMLQRQASPEAEVVFEFGIPPKPKSGSYSLKKPIVKESSLLESTSVYLPALKGGSNRIEGPNITSDSPSDFLQASVDQAASKSNYNHLGPADESILKKIIGQPLKHDKVEVSAIETDSQAGIGSMLEIPKKYIDGSIPASKSILVERDNNLSLPNLSNSPSRTRVYEKKMSRLPSKKPRIKKPFPDALNIAAYPRSINRPLKLPKKTIDSHKSTENDSYPPSNVKLQSSVCSVLMRGGSIDASIDDMTSSLVNPQHKPTELDTKTFIPESGIGETPREMTEGVTVPVENEESLGDPLFSFNHTSNRKLVDKEPILPHNRQSNSPKPQPINTPNYSSLSMMSHILEPGLREKPEFHEINKQSQDYFTSPRRNLPRILKPKNDCRCYNTCNEHLGIEEVQHSESTSPTSSRAESELSGPRSPNLNQGQVIRSLLTENHYSEGISGVDVLHNNSGKGRMISQEAESHFDASKIDKSSQLASMKVEYKKVIESYNIFVDLVKDCEKKSKVIEEQNAQIIELGKIGRYSDEKIKKLEIEAIALKKKSDRFTNICKRYNDRMSEVVVSQNNIKQQGKEIERRLKPIEKLPGSLALEIRELKEAIQVTTEKFASIRQNLSTVSKDIQESNKDLTEKNLKLSEDKKASIIRNQDLEMKNREFERCAVNLEAEKTKLVSSMESLKARNQELEASRMRMTEQLRKFDLAEQEILLEKNSLEKQLRDEIISTNKEMAQMVENFDREKNKSEILEKQLESFQIRHEELLELVQQMPASVASELIKEGSLLSDILNIGNATQARIDEAMSGLQIGNTETLASLVKLIKDVSFRLGISLEKQDEGGLVLGHVNKMTESLKESLYDLKHENQVHMNLNASISSLQKNNEALLKERNTLQSEMRLKSSELNELKSKLQLCEDDLRTKVTELNSAMNSLKEDPQIKVKVQNLKTENIDLRDRLEFSNQEISSLKGEYMKESKFKEEKIKELEHALSIAELKIKDFDDERNRYIKKKDEENKNLCQELTKKAESSKATMRLKLETEVKNLEQKIRGKAMELSMSEKELATVREDLRKLQGQQKTQEDLLRGFEAEIASYKEQFSQQASQLELLENRYSEPSTEDNIEATLCTVLKEISELRTTFESIKLENARLIAITSTDQQENIKNPSNPDVQPNIGTTKVLNNGLYGDLQNLRASLVHNSNRFNYEKLGAENPAEELHLAANRAEPASHIACENSYQDSETFEETESIFQDVDETVQCSYHGMTDQEHNGFPAFERLLANKDPSISMEGQNTSVSNDNSCLFESKPSINNPIDGEPHYNNSYSSSLTDIDSMMENLPSVLCQEQLSQEYKKTRKPKSISDQNLKSTSPPNINNQGYGLCGSKHRLIPPGSNETANILCQEPDGVEGNGPLMKKQRQRANYPLSTSGKSKRGRPGFTKPNKSSPRNQVDQRPKPKSVSENRRTELNLKNRSTGQLVVGTENQRAEPAESNVKQRRQEAGPHALGEILDSKGANFSAASRAGTQVQQNSMAHSLTRSFYRQKPRVANML